MRQRLFASIAAGFAILLTLTACGNSTHPGSSGGTSAASNSSPGSQQHNDADVMFAQHMIPHHQQAVQMSDVILGKQGIDPRVLQLANQIKAAQGPEIQQMQTWLSQWGSPTTPTNTSSMTPESTMPGMTSTSGMMSENDMQALQSAQGVDASKVFLSQMIQHHQGAIAMAQVEVKSGQYPPAIALAHSIISNQQKEINTMQNILGSL